MEGKPGGRPEPDGALQAKPTGPNVTAKHAQTNALHVLAYSAQAGFSGPRICPGAEIKLHKIQEIWSLGPW